MSNRLTLLPTIVLVAFVSWPSLPSDATEPLLEDEDIYGDYLVIGDRVLLKNPFFSVERLFFLPKGYEAQWEVWWEEDVRLTYSDTSYAFGPRVAVNDTHVHVGWRDDRINRRDKIFYKRSPDLGHTWQEDMLISDPPEEMYESSPDMALTTNCLHVVWAYYLKPLPEQGHVYYRRSLDNGATWGDIYYLSSYDMQSRPSIATFGDTVYVVFTRTIEHPYEPNEHFTILRKSYDEGATWTEPHVIADYYAECISGVLRANEAGLHYVFQHKDDFDDPGNPHRSQEIFYVHSPDRDTTWTDPIIVSHRDSIHSQWASMCVDNEGTVHITWFDYKYSPYPETGDIFYTNSTDNGQSWSLIQVLTDAHYARGSDIIASEDFLYLVWEDERQPSHNFDIYFRHSSDHGESWETEQRLTEIEVDSWEPAIAEQSDTLYVVWGDKRHNPTNHREEIYFKRGIVGAAAASESSPTQHSLYLTSYPNPFNERVILQYGIAGDYRDQRVLLKIYNVRGQLVRTILDSDLASGEYRSVWDGTDSRETKVSSGVYLCVLQVGHDRLASRLLYLK
jgi:hypothetical protein